MTKNTSLFGQNESELKDALGLSEAEFSVYLAALELGAANVQEISRKSGIKRTSMYSFIDTLKERQFLTELKKRKRKLYVATDPRTLIDRSKMRTQSLERLVPQLLAINNNAQNKPKISFHEGMKGLQEVYNMVLHDKQTIYAWEDIDRMLGVLPVFLRKYAAERSARNIPLRSIIRDTPLAREFVAKNNVQLSRDSRFIACDELATDIEVFGNKVALFSLRKDFPFAVLIEDAGIAKTLKTAWTELWNRLEPTSDVSK